MPIKVGLHPGNKAGPFGTPMEAGMHPGNKAGPFKSHGIIPSWCNILL
ncbi:conserved domain protein [Prevotella denticola CRIS 18C-A]|uniref:Conserved domain protein n=1 Tax=Prevotella denticola CRIS 18C-A TaxID=944557 RepID=F0H4E0_9BACT|nr:conserved domain protein [Prevotella denticola CRIS 18C-A]